MLPEDVILNTRRAFSTSNTTRGRLLGEPRRARGPLPRAGQLGLAASRSRTGDCAPRSVMILAPWFKRFDIGATKRFDVGGSKNIEVRFDVLNVLDTPNFTPVTEPAATPAATPPRASRG